DAVGVAAMRDVLVPGPDLETGRAGVDQKGGDEFTLAARGILLAGGGKQDHEVRMVGVTDEVLGAVYDEVAAPRQCRGLHAAQLLAQPAALFDLALVRHELAADEFTRGGDDQLLFFGERKVHRLLLTPRARRSSRRRS